MADTKTSLSNVFYKHYGKVWGIKGAGKEKKIIYV